MPQHEFITRQLIDKGWSEDRKYCVTDEQGNKFLLRVSPIEQYDRKKSEYEQLEETKRELEARIAEEKRI